MAWRGVRGAANQFSSLPSTEAICLTLERKNPVPGQDTQIWTQSQRFDIQARHPATPTLKVHLTLLKLVCLFLSSCLSHKHTPVHTEVTSPRAKSNYGSQIPLCKSSPVCDHRLYMYFLIQDKSSKGLRCILSLAEGWLNRCAVAVQISSTLLVFPHILQNNVSPKSIKTDNRRLHIDNERYIHTSNGIKSSNCVICYNKSLTAPCSLKWKQKTRCKDHNSFFFFYLTGL